MSPLVTSSLVTSRAETDTDRRLDPSLSAYLTGLAAEPAEGPPADPPLPLAALSAGGTTDALAALTATERLIVIGAPGAGKTGLLRRHCAHLAGQALRGAGRVPVYLDLATARPGESVEEMVARCLGAAGAGEHNLATLAPVFLGLDNLDRATDVYLLEGLELLLRAGGHAGPAVVVACREADWPAYRSWFEGIPILKLEPLSAAAIGELIERALPADRALAAQRWLARDAALSAALRLPLALAAFLETVRHAPPETWRRGRVLEALLESSLAAAPQAERQAYRAALSDIALGGIGQGRLIEVDTVAMGLGVTRDDMIRTGAVVARGASLEFVEPLLARHCAATALLGRTAGEPRQLAMRLAELPSAQRADLVVAVYSLAPDPVAFLIGLLEGPEGAPLAARCLVEPVTAEGAGTAGAAAAIDALCARMPGLPSATLYHLGEELARLGQPQAGVVALRAALEHLGDAPDLDAIWNRPDVDPAPPLAEWMRRYVSERNRGLALRGARDPDGAAVALQRADEVIQRLAADLTFEQGLTATAAGAVDAACAAFAQAVEADPDRVRYLYHHGRALVSLGRATDAIGQLQRARDLAPGQAEIEAALGEAYRAREWIEEALASFEAARTLSPQTPAYALAVGELWAELGDLDAAAAAMGEAIEGKAAADEAAVAETAEADWHDRLGQVLAERGRWPGAARAFARAHALSPASALYLRHLGRARLALGETDGAIEVLEQAARRDPEAAGVLADLGLALATAGRTETAIEVLQRAVALDDAWPADHLWLARLSRETGALDQALAHAERAAALAPASALAQADLGRVHQARGDYREALAAFNRAVQQAPDGWPAVAVQAAPAAPAAPDEVMVPAPECDEALQRLAPDSPAYAQAQAQRAAELGHFDAAIAALEEAISDCGQSARLYFALGSAYSARGSAIEARHAFARSAELDPDNPLYLRALALQSADDDPQAAIDLLRQALGASPDDPEMLYQLGLLVARVGDDEAALVPLERAAMMLPTEAEYARAHGECLARLGRPGAADWLRRSLALDPANPATHAALAEVYAREGRYPAALDAYASATRLAPEAPVLWRSLGTLRLAREDAAGAVEALAEAIRLDPTDAESHASLEQALEQVDRAADHRRGPDTAGGQDDDVAAKRPDPADGRDDDVALHGPELAGEPDDAASWLARAQAADDAGDVAEAIQAYRRALTLAPERATTALRLAELVAGAGWKVPLAVPETAPGMNEAEALDLAARLQALRAQPDAALAVRAMRALAVIRGRLGDGAGAVAAAEWAGEQDDDPATLLIMGWARLAAGDATGALESIGLARALGMDGVEVHVLAGRAHVRRRDLHLAVEAFTRSVERAPELPEAHAELAVAEAGLGRHAAALAAYLQANTLAGGGWCQEIGRTAVLAEAVSTARAAIEACAEQAPEDPEVQHALALARQADGDTAGATAAFEQALRAAPDRAGWQAELAALLRAAGDREAARQHYHQAAVIEPARVDYRLADAELALELGLTDQAGEAVEAALAADPEDLAALALHGRLALAAGDTAVARQAFERAVLRAPGDARLHHGLGLVARAEHDRAAARAHFETAAQLDQSALDTYLALGELYEADRALDDAIQAYQQAVVCDITAVEPHLRLGQVCLAAGLTDKAMAHFQRACELAPDDYRPWYAIGRAQLAARAPDQAVHALAAAIQRQPDLAELCFEAGLAYKELRDYGRAAELFRQTMRLAPSNTAAYTQYVAVSALHFLDRSSARAAGSRDEADDAVAPGAARGMGAGGAVAEGAGEHEAAWAAGAHPGDRETAPASDALAGEHEAAASIAGPAGESEVAHG